MADLQIEGIQEAQQANLEAIAALETHGAFGRAIKKTTQGAQAYSAKITHVDTGALKASQRIKIEQADYKGIVFLDPDAFGPSGAPAEYGPYEHNRGGSHAFFERTVREAGKHLSDQAIRTIVRAALYGG